MERLGGIVGSFGKTKGGFDTFDFGGSLRVGNGELDSSVFGGSLRKENGELDSSVFGGSLRKENRELDSFVFGGSLKKENVELGSRAVGGSGTSESDVSFGSLCEAWVAALGFCQSKKGLDTGADSVVIGGLGHWKGFEIVAEGFVADALGIKPTWVVESEVLGDGGVEIGLLGDFSSWAPKRGFVDFESVWKGAGTLKMELGGSSGDLVS